jgi:hypothetical protein
MVDVFCTAICDLQHQSLARLLSTLDIKPELPIPTHETIQQYICML